ncbi:BamA/TamA family outer membrane protein [Haloplanus aerogenes]|uniref:Big-1 domain-containing protein n=1 Tax=Haloplanus aerogenes TaxID=660522 RepID=A0A3M0D8E7_9EURY|nr:hypothetical protein [Haloplanus aerogenes]AZH26478.1 hypothetical protein DU502_14360 [Haloplanus aerogenes]RMB18052.1 hypothetical protein ATH50_1498 [Haloplanus aerogenes]
MSFRGDRRAVTVQVGAILLFGILVLLLATYQATIVPQQNEQVEFNHNVEVQQDLLTLRGELLEAADGEQFRAVTIKLGTTYPERALFVNPPPASGTIGTADAGGMGVHNVRATNEETRDYLNGSQEYGTNHVSYRPSYSVYQNAPATTYQSGVLVNGFDSGRAVAISEQSIVRGNEIRLVAVAGNLSRSQVRAMDVQPRSLSTVHQSTTVRDNGSGIEITVPTTLSEDAWESLLRDELDPAGDPNNDRYVTGVTDVAGTDAVRITLEAGRTYRLRTALVGVGMGGETPQPAYVTNVTERNTSLAAGTPLVVEVRDRYNNPVDPTTYPTDVTVNVTEGRDLVAQNRTTVRADGRAQVTYTGGEGTVTLAVERLSGPESEVSFNVTERTTSDSDDSNDTTPNLRVRVDDLTNTDTGAPHYIVSYDASNANGQFDRVEVKFMSDSGGSGTEIGQSERGSVEFQTTYGGNTDYYITLRAYYEDGNGGTTVERIRTVIDEADARNPSDNEDLSESGSPSLASWSIEDRTNNNVRYRFQYDVDTRGNFRNVYLGVISRDGNGGKTVENTTQSGRTWQGSTYGVNAEYKVTILVTDADGVVVEEKMRIDRADGDANGDPP